MTAKGIMGIPSKPAYRSGRYKLTTREIAARKRIATALKEYCDQPFGKGLPGYENLTYDLNDYNREIDEMRS